METELILGRPSEKQRRFLMDHHKIVGYGGARGGGKSWAIQTKAKLLSFKHPGIRIAIFRRKYPDLEKNHIRILTGELVGAKVAKYQKQEKRLTMVNGSVIEFVFAQRTDELIIKTQGIEWDVIFVDEATQWTEEELKIIYSCCRGANEHPKRIYLTCNPGGVGHQYIKRIFLDKKYLSGEHPEDYSFTQAKLTDNEALMKKDPEYIKNLEALPPKLRKAWLEGEWDVFSGQVFEEFRDVPEHYEDRQWTHVIEPFDIPIGWTICRSYDFGYSKPFSCAWWAVDYDGRLYRILELYGCTQTPNEGVKWTPQEQFKRIHEIETQHPWLKGRKIIGVADPAIWKAESGESVADVAAQHQIYFDKGDNERIAGWMQLHYRLAFDDNGIPMMYIFSNCKAFIRTIPLLVYDEHKVEDIDTTQEDHVADETRYECMSRPIRPQRPEVHEKIMDDPLNQRVYKQRAKFIPHG